MNTIGAYPEEIEAYEMINFLGKYMAPIFIGASIIQFGAFCLYNWVLHPFKVLVQVPETKANNTFSVEMQAPTTEIN